MSVAYDDTQALDVAGVQAVYVEAEGERVRAHAKPDLGCGVFVTFGAGGLIERLFRLHPTEPWPTVVEITDEVADDLRERPGMARLRDAQAEAHRRAELRMAEGMDPIDWQKRNGEFLRDKALTIVEFRKPDETGRRLVRRTERAYADRRQKVDNRIWSSLSDDHKRAADDIEDGFRGITAGLGARCMPFEERSGAPKGQGLNRARIPGLETVIAYWDWMQACRWCGISAAAVLDVIVHGKPCVHVDRNAQRYTGAKRGKRNGWARQNLIAGLDLYLDPDAIRDALDRAVEETRRDDRETLEKIERRLTSGKS